MRTLVFTGLFLALSAGAAFAANFSDASRPGESRLVEGRAALVTPVSEFGTIGNDFGPGFNFGAPANAMDFEGAEVSAEAVVIK
jgi:hypothetical protein